MSTVAHFFIIIVAQKFVITWLTFSLTFTIITAIAFIFAVEINFRNAIHMIGLYKFRRSIRAI